MAARRTVIVLGLLAATLAGCASGGRRGSVPQPGVAPLTEAEFDAFTMRVAERTTQVLRLRGAGPAAIIAPPMVETNGVEPRESALAFADNLVEGLNDRLIGVARVQDPYASTPTGDAQDAEGQAATAEQPVMRSSLTFAQLPVSSGSPQPQRMLTFTLMDARDGSELLRESFPYSPQAIAASPEIATARQRRPSPTRATSPPNPAPEGAETRVTPPAVAANADDQTGYVDGPPPGAPPTPTADESPPAGSVAEARVERPPPPTRTPPRTTAAPRRTVRRPLPRESRTAPQAADEASRSSRAARRAASAAERQRIKIDRDEEGLAEFLAGQAEFYRERIVAAPLGEVWFIDEGAWQRFRLLAQRGERSADGRLRVELDIRSRDRRRNAELRVIFLDAEGRQTEVSPVIPERFLGDYTRTVLFASAGTRSHRYIVLLKSD